MTSLPQLVGEHSIICARQQDRFGYFGWPSIASQDDGTLIVASSGLRFRHICPWGKSVLCRSQDLGKTWSEPTVVNNTPLDDRDTGIISLGGQRLALTWFTSNTNKYREHLRQSWTPEDMQMADAIMDSWTAETHRTWDGSWIRISPDGEYWGDFRRAPVNSPHGFIVRADGSWLYLGKCWEQRQKNDPQFEFGAIRAVSSVDEGKTWTPLGKVPLPDGYRNEDTHEPHVVELTDGTLLGFIRHHKPFQILTTRSMDGGETWEKAQTRGILGSPPHAFQHSSGAVVCVYGYREKPYGQRVMISWDKGQTWQHDLILRDDGHNTDLGYPASIELPDGDILTIYYQKITAEDVNCSLLQTRWKLP